MIPFCKCVCCNQEIDNIFVQGSIEVQGSRITKAICKPCYERTKDKWDENDWEVKESNDELD